MQVSIKIKAAERCHLHRYECGRGSRDYVWYEICFDRERPYDRYPDRVDARSHESSPSFPSGHTAAAFSLATSLSIRYPKWYVIAPSAFWACSVGFSRMNEGVHYPSDVAAGAVIGAGCAVSQYLCESLA